MKIFIRYSWFLFGMVFLVILAGGVVRMTQSGMGCPDWPRCFGSWIPPTNASQLPPDFEKYLDKQDIDHSFNVYHTWIEYINRLLGALLGLFIIPYVVITFRKFWKQDRFVFWLAFSLLILTGFQGFMGKLVVDANLAVAKITIHMLIALLIAAVPLFIIRRIGRERIIVPKIIYYSAYTCLLFVLVQIILGTQVREEVDIISKSLSYENRELWINRLGEYFIIHRSFSWLIAIIAGYLWFKSRTFPRINKISTWIVGFVLISIGIGIVMNYMDMPAIAQPLHLLSASGLCMCILYFISHIKK